MGSYSEDWGDLSWTTDGTISSLSISNGSSSTGDAVSNDGMLDTEVSVEIAYGATYSADAVLYILRDVDGTNYEDKNTAYGVSIPGATSTTRRRTITVPSSVARFKCLVDNPSGAAVTATVRRRQSTGATA